MKKFLKFEFSIYGGNVFVFLAFRYVALLYHSWGDRYRCVYCKYLHYIIVSLYNCKLFFCDRYQI